MANSRYEYVRKFETDDRCLPGCWIVVRVDGRDFHKFSDKHSFSKPNDQRSLDLMSHCAKRVMQEYRDAVVSYGQSDEYSIVFNKDAETYNRRTSKLTSCICSLFTSTFVFCWKDFFPDTPLKYPPSFDSRVVLYPNYTSIRDYISWRQVDCHINNLYNTTFWALVQQGGLTPAQAEEKLKGSFSADKNEILFSQFGVNYNNIPEIYKKGTVLYRKCKSVVGAKEAKNIMAEHRDIIGEKFWEENKHLLGSEKS